MRADAIGYVSEGPSLSLFTLFDRDVYPAYSTTARGLEPMMVSYGVLDRVPRGRDEGDPADPMWMRRHNEFANAIHRDGRREDGLPFPR